jgi:hypothetical protein
LHCTIPTHTAWRRVSLSDGRPFALRPAFALWHAETRPPIRLGPEREEADRFEIREEFLEPATWPGDNAQGPGDS